MSSSLTSIIHPDFLHIVAIAALKSDGSVVTWVSLHLEGTAVDVSNSLTSRCPEFSRHGMHLRR
ncbi:hypothetical protein U9R62_06915 [Cylindrospermopsis raciborskii DSH]|uniref:hypothetical protein n=1 Tax=Cylindrospermopsis raciborskii TaxID=77022 RepID=UPI002EDBA5DA